MYACPSLPGILKSSALRGSGSTVQADERSAIAHEIMALGVPGLLRLIYPTVYHVSDTSGSWGTQAPGQGVVMPATVPASLVYLDPQVCKAASDNTSRCTLRAAGGILARHWACVGAVAVARH